MARAFDALPDSADAAAYLGYHAWAQDDFEDAAKYLKMAVERESKSPATYLNYAHALMRDANPKNNLGPNRYDREMTLEVFAALKKARSLAGGFDPGLYYRFGEVLLGTRVDTKPDDFGVLVEGLNAYPRDERIAFYLALHLERSEDYETAMILVDRYLAMGLQGQAIRNFNAIRKRLSEKLGQVEEPEAASAGS